MGSSYEECRAECVGLFLATDKVIHKIFSHPEEEVDDIVYTSWLWMVRAGVLGISAYNPEKGEFMQAHSHARYVIYKMLEEAGVVEINFTEQHSAFTITVHRDLIHTVGLTALSDFLIKLNVFKATADLEQGTQLYNKYSVVDDASLQIRNICLTNSKPRREFVQPTLRLLPNGPLDNRVEYIKYENTHVGMIQSFLDKRICY
jgi:dipeptidyl-peptidase-3